jgi:hypothetical protein
MIFVVDTNVLWKTRELVRLAAAARRHGHRVEVPALAHAERLAQLRRQKRQEGKTFDPRIVEAFLQTHGLQVAPFDEELAERCAGSLAERYRSADEWHDARKRRCASRFQMVQDDAGKTCPATIDWYLHAPYEAAPFVFVILDGGSEFAGTGSFSLDAAIRRAEEA